MSKILRSTKGLPTSAVVLAAILLASCGADTAMPDAAAVPAGEVVDPSTDPAAAADPAEGPAVPVNAEPAPEPAPGSPLKEAAQPAAAVEPAYIGTWGTDLAQCAIAQDYEQPPMIMRADGFDQHEAHCEFETVMETGSSQWNVTGQCSVEGDEQPLDYNMAIIDGNLVHWSGDARKDAWTLVRCPE